MTQAGVSNRPAVFYLAAAGIKRASGNSEHSGEIEECSALGLSASAFASLSLSWSMPSQLKAVLLRRRKNCARPAFRAPQAQLRPPTNQLKAPR